MPSLQVPQIDRPHGARGQTHVPRHLSRRRTLTSLPHRLFETLAEWRLTRQLCDLLRPYPTMRALHPVGLHHHRRPVLKAGQVAYFALADFVDLTGRHVLPTTRANQLQSCFLPPHPQLQFLARLVNLHAIDPVPGPSQHPRPVVFPHPSRLTNRCFSEKLAFRVDCRIPKQSGFLSSRTVGSAWAYAHKRVRP